MRFFIERVSDPARLHPLGKITQWSTRPGPTILRTVVEHEEIKVEEVVTRGRGDVYTEKKNLLWLFRTGPGQLLPLGNCPR